MSCEDDSFSVIGLNVLGSPNVAIRNRPPEIPGSHVEIKGGSVNAAADLLTGVLIPGLPQPKRHANENKKQIEGILMRRSLTKTRTEANDSTLPDDTPPSDLA
ncbi:MAG: hypothetical protein JW388_0400 [Nitrospira sp.]|nr:hypothetical protein [Nitrospira sp.]